MKRILFLLALILAPAVSYADGMFPAVPAATPPLTGNETVPADTHLSGGRNPQTVLITTSQLKDYAFGGTSSGTVSAVAGAATLNTGRGVVTSESLTTAAGAVYTLTLTDSVITADSIVLVSVGNGSNTTVGPGLVGVVPSAGSATIAVRNTHAASAFNGTIKISFVVIN